MAETKLPEYNTPSNSLTTQSAPVAKTTPGGKQLPPKQAPVVKASTAKKSRADKLKEDSRKAIIEVGKNTIWPGVKNLVFNALMNAVGGIFWPDGNRPMNISSNHPLNRVDYGSYFTGGTKINTSGSTIKATNPEPYFKYPMLDTPDDCALVIDELRNIIKSYGCATWATLYDICNMDNTNWQGSQKYGWVSVENTKIYTVHTADGQIKYELHMPKAAPIDDLPF